ncbi:thiol reductant ABC exporter subunit CydD [Bombilactobacillus thymidiniphilus]|uniref:Thiol reductant ABC exporter subunit CydD n=1 Tax=Bombilactobacillus thymidiniphilus TaxID=2923363 RepID=A0ABY4PCH3_9LACO|nr:thiol reductant ABC exporter subunit CydD [Bombilactobacillus thymidiniphilus]UQS82977.1 thiol reductant ABC exporter subunit CydD [Bombilactobacillus thymidiniphilus]
MIDKRLFQLPGVKSLFQMLAGLTILQAFAILLQAKYLAESLVILWHRQNWHLMLIPLVFFVIAFLVRHLLTWLKDILLDRFATKSTEHLRQQSLAKIYAAGLQMTAKKGSGNLVTNVLNGMDDVHDYFNLILSKFMNLAIIPWVILCFVFYQDHTSGIILILVFPVIILFMIILGYAAQRKADNQYSEYVTLSNHFLDALRGLPTLKMLGLSKQYAHNVYSVSESYRKRTMSTLRVAILSTFALDWFTTLSIAIVAVFLGLGLMNGRIALYPALIALILSPEYFLPLRDFSSDYHATLNGKNAFTAVNELIATPITAPQKQLDSFTWNKTSQLTLEHIDFDYDQQPTLKDLSLQLAGFQKIAIIGQSGSGKSTLLDLLGGFLTPNAGQVIVNEQVIPNLAQINWQNQVTYLPQKPHLFSDTIANNILFYQPKAAPLALQKAVQQAGLTEFIASLPDGLDTLVGEGGRGISGGQAQRIMLARAFLANQRHILLFDEPTAHLDIETEYKLKQTMLPLFENHLVIFATHRLHWLQQMDYVIVMDQGKIVEQGPIEQLQKQNTGPFYELTSHMRGEQ